MRSIVAMVSGLLSLESAGPLKVGLHGCWVTRGHSGHQTSATHQEAVAGGHHLVCTVQSWIVLPSLRQNVRMGATSLLQVLLHDPDLVLILLGVVLDMLPQAAGISVPLAAPNHLASVWLL